MVFRSFIVACICTFLQQSAPAQDTVMQFDRPGLADLPYVVPPKTVQAELGYELGLDDSLNFMPDLSPGLLLRFNIIQCLELRLAIHYIPVSMHHIRYTDVNRTYHLAVGGKVRILKEKDAWPGIANTSLVTFPVQGFLEPSPNLIGAETYFLFNHYFTDYFYFNYNLGYIYGNRALGHTFNYSTSFNFSVHAYVELFVEHFAYIHNKNVPDWGLDGGIMVYPMSRMQVDLSYIRIFNALGGNHIFSLGLSYNFNLQKRKKIFLMQEEDNL